MDQTYAEIENTYGQISTTSSPMSTTPKSRPRRHRQRHRDHFDSGLPIEFRYPKRNSMTSSASVKQRSLASKSSSSGYSSASSVSSVMTVVNGAKPYRPMDAREYSRKKEKQTLTDAAVISDNKKDTSMSNRFTSEESSEDEETEKTPRSRACCIDCREKELRHELDLESHQYANLKSLQKPQDPYVFLMTSMLTSLQKEDGASRKVAKVQQKIEKVLRMAPREPLATDNKLTFDCQVSSFASDVTIRLRAVSEVSPDTYREISAKFCEALHQGTPTAKGLKGIVKGVKSLLSF